MWIINFLPEWAFHILFFVGLVATIAGFALGMIPVIKKYGLALKLLGGFVLFLAIFLEGGLNDYKEWEFKANQLKAQLADMEKQKTKVDTQIVEKVITKTQIVRQKGQDVIQYVDREVVKYDEKFAPGAQCELPNEFFKAYNDSLGKDQK